MSNIKQTRISLRKGLKSDLPSHAPLGEPLYCVDSDELYIGKGEQDPIELIGGKTVSDRISDIIEGPRFSYDETGYEVDSQEKFDTLNSYINSKLAQGVSRINILLSRGTYKFDDLNKIVLRNCINPQCEIRIVAKPGERVNIISKGQTYTPSDSDECSNGCFIVPVEDYEPFYNFVDGDYEPVLINNTGVLDPRGFKINTSKSQILKSDDSKCIVKLELPEELNFLKNKNEKYFEKSLLRLTTWFTECNGYPVSSDDTYIYFRVPESKYRNHFDGYINGDYHYAKQNPCFIIENIPSIYGVSYSNSKLKIPTNVRSLTLCKYSSFISIESCQFKNMTISGIRFMGSSKSHNLFDMRSAFISIKNSTNIDILDCKFRNIGAIAINVDSSIPSYSNYTTSNITISRNDFKNIGENCVYAMGENITVTNNKCQNIGLFRKDSVAIDVTGKDYLVSNNEVVDFTYIGVRVGNTREPNREISGIIECNEIYHTPNYNADFMKNTLMDGGFIYVFTHNDNTIVRFNVIHDVHGRRDYRGIFCDDGCYNTTLENNLIYRCTGYTIDCRYVNNIIGSNKNNKMSGNILFGKYKFEGTPNASESEIPILNANVIGADYSYLQKRTSTLNSKVESNDIYSYNSFVEDNIVYLDTFVPDDIFKDTLLEKYTKKICSNRNYEIYKDSEGYANYKCLSSENLIPKNDKDYYKIAIPFPKPSSATNWTNGSGDVRFNCRVRLLNSQCSSGNSTFSFVLTLFQYYHYDEGHYLSSVSEVSEGRRDVGKTIKTYYDLENEEVVVLIQNGAIIGNTDDPLKNKQTGIIVLLEGIRTNILKNQHYTVDTVNHSEIGSSKIRVEYVREFGSISDTKFVTPVEGKYFIDTNTGIMYVGRKDSMEASLGNLPDCYYPESKPLTEYPLGTTSMSISNSSWSVGTGLVVTTRTKMNHINRQIFYKALSHDTKSRYWSEGERKWSDWV